MFAHLAAVASTIRCGSLPVPPDQDGCEAHADLHITGQAFDRVAWHLQATLQELEVQRDDQQAILAAVGARRDEIVTFEES